MDYDIKEWKHFEATKERFLAKVNKTDTCWLWTAAKLRKNSYGHFSLGNKNYLAHRISYMLFNGPILPDKMIRHTCDIKGCVNPAHLILGTNSDNIKDALKRSSYKIIQQKLNEEAVKVIKWYLKYRPEPGLAAKLARLYKVSPTTIYDIKKRGTWSWVKV